MIYGTGLKDLSFFCSLRVAWMRTDMCLIAFTFYGTFDWLKATDMI